LEEDAGERCAGGYWAGGFGGGGGVEEGGRFGRWCWDWGWEEGCGGGGWVGFCARCCVESGHGAGDEGDVDGVERGEFFPPFSSHFFWTEAKQSQKTHAAIVTLAADDPLIKEQETTLEKQHAWFALSLAHEADTVFSLRLLDTGAAKDVSGVVRITHGGARTENHEYLYHVGGDGGVRVFERGQ
jgi:hypothetical protein